MRESLHPLHCVLYLRNVAGGDGRRRGHRNHGPFPRTVCARRGLILGIGFKFGCVHLCCE
jgi:hypothetical protein